MKAWQYREVNKTIGSSTITLHPTRKFGRIVGAEIGDNFVWIWIKIFHFVHDFPCRSLTIVSYKFAKKRICDFWLYWFNNQYSCYHCIVFNERDFDNCKSSNEYLIKLNTVLDICRANIASNGAEILKFTSHKSVKCIDFCWHFYVLSLW